jgi:hypothetical protein
MTAVDAAQPSNAPLPVGAALRQSERRFYTGMVLAAAAMIFAGFAPTYYLKSVTGSRELPLLVHVHGAAFTAWVILFLVQVRLIAGRKLAVHRRLGFATVALGAAMIVLGFLTAVAGGRRGTTVDGVTAQAFMLIPLTDLLVFGVLVTLAVIYRRRSAIHKRLMLLAFIGGLLLPAISRLPWVHDRPPVILLIFGAFLAAGAVHDRLTTGRIHPVNKWGAVAVFLTVPLRFAISGTSGWERVATWLIG